MLDYWFVSRPKRKLDSVPEILAQLVDHSLGQQWRGQRGTQLAFEEGLEEAGLKRPGERRDQSGSGGRTYGAWLTSLGLIFQDKKTRNIRLTLAGEAIMHGDSPVDVLKNQVLKYQFPSAYSVSRGVQINGRFHIRPFRFLLRLLSDDDLERYLTEDEIGKIVIVDAFNETQEVYNNIIKKILSYRCYGDGALDSDFLAHYKRPNDQLGSISSFRPLLDIANTLINWLEYTQLARRDDNKRLRIVVEKQAEVDSILSTNPPFIDRPEDHEYYQRKYGLDPKHKKDTRSFENSGVVTAKMIAEMKVKRAYIEISSTRPVTGVTSSLIEEIVCMTGIVPDLVEEVLFTTYPRGSIGAFMASYYDMAFKGHNECTEFEEATTEIFREIFGFVSKHYGQSGSISTPDVLLISDSDGYQAVIDNKAYSQYSISGDHANRMIHNYLGNINRYSDCTYPIGFFSYIAGGFANTVDRQLRRISRESGISGSAITVSNFIKMVENHQSGTRVYTHNELRSIFGSNKQVSLTDIC